jgi:pimeloyl-ACP methyl ester carboxylesterase
MRSILFALLSGAAAIGANGANAEDATRNIVLVHSTFADESSWDKVAVILINRGYTVTRVANPLTSLADDVAATTAALEA